MLTEKQIKLIKQNWRKIRGVDAAVIGDVFYQKLFLDLPMSKKMFTTSRSEQAVKLLDMLSLIVARLERLDEINEEIKQLAIRHVEYGVKPDHYKYVGSALIWTLKTGSGLDWDDEIEQAWIECYTIITQTMLDAAHH